MRKDKNVRDGIRGEELIRVQAEITVSITEGAEGGVRCEHMRRV